MWIPARGMLLTGDAWVSGFLGHVRTNHADRVSFSGYREANRGFWGARIAVEQRLELDPDLRDLTLVSGATDPSFAAVPHPYRLSRRSGFATAERSLHLLPIGRASVLDGAVFGATSLRWDAPNTDPRTFGVTVVGARLRLLATNGASTSWRIDVAYPVRADAPVVHRPLLSVSVAPLLDAPRMRDGQRRQQ
jgi:hypothetical protein